MIASSPRALLAQQRLDRRAPNHRRVVAGEAVLIQQLAHLELHQVQKLRVVDQVALVQEHHDVRHAHLTGQQDVLARLGHRAVRRRHHQDRAVHLRRAGDHVLHVVGVARAVDVRVVALVRRVLDVRRRDRQNLRRVATPCDSEALPTSSYGMNSPSPSSGPPGHRRRQRRLAVVDVADRPHVHVRLRTIEFLLGHGFSICQLPRAGLGCR